MFHTPLVSVEFWIAGYYDPDRHWLAGSQDSDLSYYVPISNIRISRLCCEHDVRLSVCLSKTEVHWRIIRANLRFKFRSEFTVHCCRGEGSSQQQHLALC